MEPEFNQKAIANLGECLFKEYAVEIFDSLKLKNSIVLKDIYDDKYVFSGNFCKVGLDSKYEYYVEKKEAINFIKKKGGSYLAILKSQDDEIFYYGRLKIADYLDENFIRPAFSTDFYIDLRDGDIFGYKNSRLQVINATNESLEYKVLRGF